MPEVLEIQRRPATGTHLPPTPREWGPPPANPARQREWLLERIHGTPADERQVSRVDELVAEADAILKAAADDDGLEQRAATTTAAPKASDPLPRVKHPTTIRGLAVPWLDHSEPIGRDVFVERFSPVAFDEQARETGFAGVLAQWSHVRAEPIGRAPDSLTLTIGRAGLEYEMRPVGARGRDVLELVAERVATGASIGFIQFENRWDTIDWEGDEMPRSTVTKALLRELSIVTSPAYRQTTAIARQAQQAPPVTARPARPRPPSNSAAVLHSDFMSKRYPTWPKRSSAERPELIARAYRTLAKPPPPTRAERLIAEVDRALGRRRK